MITQTLADLGWAQIYYPRMTNITGTVAATIFLQYIIQQSAYLERDVLKEHERDEDGYYFQQERIEDATGLTPSEQRTARKLLREKGFLHEKKKGIPARNHYKVDAQKINAAWQHFLATGESAKGEKSRKRTEKARAIAAMKNRQTCSNSKSGDAVTAELTKNRQTCSNSKSRDKHSQTCSNSKSGASATEAPVLLPQEANLYLKDLNNDLNKKKKEEVFFEESPFSKISADPEPSEPSPTAPSPVNCRSLELKQTSQISEFSSAAKYESSFERSPELDPWQVPSTDGGRWSQPRGRIDSGFCEFLLRHYLRKLPKNACYTGVGDAEVYVKRAYTISRDPSQIAAAQDRWNVVNAQWQKYQESKVRSPEDIAGEQVDRLAKMPKFVQVFTANRMREIMEGNENG
jgi:hypothetical protein